ncbi:MAG: pyridoxal phosphate-dependent decarboxylase family protein, partial [Polyangiales bacterium]
MLEALRELEAALEAESSAHGRSRLAASHEPPAATTDRLASIFDSLAAGHVSTRHPRYFGPPHPAPDPSAVVARALAAAFNPQLATRSHSPWPVDVEASLLRALGERFGLPPDEIEGTFTQGGAESNLTAIVCAAIDRLEGFAEGGARGLDRGPAIYASTEAHATIARAAKIAGLGSRAVRRVPVDAQGKLKVSALREALRRDRAIDARPFMIVATAGTTSEGAIDPLEEMSQIARREECWLHVDAAWGGLLALVPE